MRFGMDSATLNRWLGRVPALPGPQGLDPDRRAQWALWSSAFLLVILVFRGGVPQLSDLNAHWQAAPDSMAARLYWVVWGLVCYLAVPAVIIAAVFRESPARYGLRVHLTRQMAVLYAALFVALAPVLYVVSLRPAFLNTYPMVHDLGDAPGRIALWELARALRFVALEFFFRGFLLFSLEARFGLHAIAVAALPYGLLHYGKPFPEALGAVVAGAVLGALALRSRSIAGGVLLHVGVATAMDMLALWHKGVLF